MKKIFAAISIIAILSCNTGRHINSYATIKNNDDIFANMKKIQCKIDIKKKFGRQLSVQ